MSWGKNSKKKPSVLTNFLFLSNFIRHTGHMVTMVTTGHQVHRQAISASKNELGEKFIVFGGNGCCGVVAKVEWLILMLSVKNWLIDTRTIVKLGSRPCPGHVQVMLRSCTGHHNTISISNLKVWTWSWLYNCNATTHHHHHHHPGNFSEWNNTDFSPES